MIIIKTQELNSKFEEGLREAERETGHSFDHEFVPYERHTSGTTHSDMCGKVCSNQIFCYICLQIKITYFLAQNWQLLSSCWPNLGWLASRAKDCKKTWYAIHPNASSKPSLPEGCKWLHVESKWGVGEIQSVSCRCSPNFWGSGVDIKSSRMQQSIAL